MFTFKKKERLCRKKNIDALFSKGKSFAVFPIRIIWLITEISENTPAQVGISVSKRKFKHAVTRNLLKRRIREALRKNKHPLYEHLSQAKTQIVFMVIYLDKEVCSYHVIEHAITEALSKLTTKINKDNKKYS